MKDHPMRSYLLFLFASFLLFTACDTKGRNIPDEDDSKPSKPQNSLSYAAINISDTTQGAADILFICTDGSYMTFDINYKDSCGILYFNTSKDNELEKGFFILIDKTGTPMMLQNREGDFFFKNVTENAYDMAFSIPSDRTSFYWDVPIDSIPPAAGSQRRIKRSWGEAITSPFVSAWSDAMTFDWTWDEHQRKALIPFAAKVASFGISAVGIASANPWDWASGVLTLYQEAAKSGLVSDKLVTYSPYIDAFLTGKGTADEWKKWVKEGKEGQFTPKGLSLSLLAMTLNEYADYALEHINQFDKASQEIYANPQLQLRLSTYRVDFNAGGDTYIVDVQTESAWYVDPYLKYDWLTVQPDENGNLYIHAEPNEEGSARYAYITLRTYSDALVAPVTVTVAQEGLAFSLSESFLTFTGEYDTKIIYVYTTDKVKDLRITHLPAWLESEKGKNSFVLNTKRSYSGSYADLTDNVAIEATFTDETKETKYCYVQWLPEVSALWDYTSWAFSGTLMGPDGSSGTVTMGLRIGSVESGQAIVDFMSVTDIPCTIQEDAAHRLKGSFSYGGINFSFEFTRSGDTATGTLFVATPDSGTGTAQLSGTLQ